MLVLALGIEGVAGEDRSGRLDLVPAYIGNDLGAYGTHTHARQHRQCERGVDERLFPLGLGGIAASK